MKKKKYFEMCTT